MSITRVQSKAANNSAGGTSVTLVFTSTPTVGNTLVIGIFTAGTGSGQVTGITQTGVTWQRAIENADVNVMTAEIWYGLVSSAPSATVLISLSSSIEAGAAAVEYSGLATSSVLDKTAMAEGSLS